MPMTLNKLGRLIFCCSPAPPDLVFHYLLSHPCSFLPLKSHLLFIPGLPLPNYSPPYSTLHLEKNSVSQYFIEIHIFRTRILLRERPSNLLNLKKMCLQKLSFLFKTQLKRYFLHVTDSDSSKNRMFSSALSNVCSVCSAGCQLSEFGNHMFCFSYPIAPSTGPCTQNLLNR